MCRVVTSPHVSRSPRVVADGRLAFSARSAGLAYGVDPKAIRAAVKRGELRAARPGLRRLLILRHDLERWLLTRRIEVMPAAEQWAADAARRDGERTAKRQGRTPATAT